MGENIHKWYIKEGVNIQITLKNHTTQYKTHIHPFN